MRYAVDGYGVFSCVIGGMIDKMRSADVMFAAMLGSGAIGGRFRWLHGCRLPLLSYRKYIARRGSCLFSRSRMNLKQAALRRKPRNRKIIAALRDWKRTSLATTQLSVRD